MISENFWDGVKLKSGTLMQREEERNFLY